MRLIDADVLETEQVSGKLNGVTGADAGAGKSLEIIGRILRRMIDAAPTVCATPADLAADLAIAQTEIRQIKAELDAAIEQVCMFCRMLCSESKIEAKCSVCRYGGQQK